MYTKTGVATESSSMFVELMFRKTVYHKDLIWKAVYVFVFYPVEFFLATKMTY